ncbi:MAG: phospholipase [Planctomycetota bacterium]|nr:phospholipase [Planctomycetota bacterium]
MSITGTELRDLHRIHKQLTDLRGRLDRGPKQVAASAGAVRRMEMDAEQAKETHQKARVASDGKQLQLRSREAKLEDLKVKLNIANSNKEFQAFKEQIAADQQANLVLEDEILESLERIDQLAEKVNKSETDLAAARSEADKVKARVEGEQANLDSELAGVLSELKVAEANLPLEFKSNYDRVARVRGEEALAEVDGEVCGGCYQMLTPNMMNELYMSRAVFCKSCGALLYLSESRGVGD